MVEVLTKRELGEVQRELVHGVVEAIAEGESDRKGVHLFTEV